EPVIAQAGHDRLAPAALALHELDLRLGQVGVDAGAVLPGEGGAAVEELVGGLFRDRGRDPDAHAAVGPAVPAADGALGEAEQPLWRGGRPLLGPPPAG